MSPTRRDVLRATAGTAGAGALAGCLGILGKDPGENRADGYAAFFPIHDWAETVGGEELSFENPVGTGRMGHGWSPDADITPEVASTELFLYLDTPEFSWAQNIASNIERDHEGIKTVDLLEGLEPYLIPFDYDGSEQVPKPEPGLEVASENVADFDIWDRRSQDQLGYWHSSRNHWHGGLPKVAVGQTAPIGIVLKDREGRVLPLGGDAPYAVEARVAAGDESAAGIDVDGATVEFEGKAVGEAEIVFEIYHSGELVYDTAPDLATLEVVEEIDEESQFYDPHTWIDPVIAQEMVTKIGEEFAGFDPDNAETYRDNAASYNGRIAAVDEQIREVVGDAELDVAIFAGHDSYQYVERRYGFELKTPVGVSPDAQVAIDDIIGLVETVEKNGIDTILYDPFEAASPGDGYPQVVERILEESSATETAPLTPLSGTTEEWEENGWGWVGQMEQINIPSLEQALNPS